MSLSVEKVLRKAQSHMKAGELAEAEELYKQVLTKFPKNKKAIQGYQKLKAGITSKGSLNSEPPTEQIDELINLYNQGRFEEVLAKAKHLIDLFPKEVTLHNIQGVSNAALQRYDAAIDSYRQAIKINPYYPDSYSNMGSALKGKGYLDAAIDSYKQALKIKPDYAEAYYNMGISLHEKGNLDAAIESYEQALKIKPNYAECYSNLGVALKDEGNLEAAIGSYKQALKIKPNYAECYSNLGVAFQDKGDLEAAMGSYKKALKIKPDYAECFVNRESLQLQISEGKNLEKNLEEHVNKSLKKILTENPEHQIYEAIYQFINRDYVSSIASLRRYNILVEVGIKNRINKKAQQFCEAYSTFINSLIEKKPTFLAINKNKIYHIGESHCLSYAHHEVTVDQQTFFISPMITFGTKAYHFAKQQENSFKVITRRNLDKIPNNSVVLISIGEIDCRANEGLIQAAQKTGEPLEKLIQETVGGYITWFLAANEKNKHRYNFLNVPAPVYKIQHTLSANQQVANVIRLFNNTLRKTLSDHYLELIDVYQPTANKTYFSNNRYHCDSIHLDKRILGLIEGQIRLKGFPPIQDSLG